MTDPLYIGLGNMGAPIAARLLRHGPLFVNDRSEAARARLEALGAIPIAGAAEVAARCDTILLCLPGPRQVRDVLFGEGGVAGLARPGTLIIDQTTVAPDMARSLAADLAARGLAFVEAPVSGGPAAAEAGSLTLIVGATTVDFGRALPLLRAISPHIFHAGPVGSASTAKLANNLLSAVLSLVTLEGLTLAARNGVDPARAAAILSAGPAANFWLDRIVPAHVLSGNPDAGYAIGIVAKDLRLAVGIGTGSGVPLPFGSLAAEWFQMVVNQLGADAPGPMIAAVMDRIAGTDVFSAAASSGPTMRSH